MCPTRYCQRWPQNPFNRCELFDVQQTPELTVELSTTQSGRMQEHSSSPSIEGFPSRRAVQSTESDKHRIWLTELLGVLLTEGDDEDWCRAGCTVPAVPRRKCRAGDAALAVPRWLCHAGAARAAAPTAPRQLGRSLRCSRSCCRSYPPSSLPLCALPRHQTCHCLHFTDDRKRHHKRCGHLTELRRKSLSQFRLPSRNVVPVFNLQGFSFGSSANPFDGW